MLKGLDLYHLDELLMKSNQELLWDKIKMLSRMGKQEFIEQGIASGLITLLMGFPLLETYSYNPCKPWKGSKH